MYNSKIRYMKVSILRYIYIYIYIYIYKTIYEIVIFRVSGNFFKL